MRVSGVQVSRTCKSVDVSYSSAIHFSFENQAFNFCDNITCVFRTTGGKEVVRVESEVVLTCQVRCMTPDWYEHGTYVVDVLRNYQSVCNSKNCTEFTF